MIPYHGTPCGSTREDVARFLSGRHALVSFARPEDIGTAAEVCQSFCLDNGAFTNWKRGTPTVDWSRYYEWVSLWKNHPACDWAVIPDVIDGDESDNDKLIEAWPHGHFGVPVWHLHESLVRLERLCENWPRVAIGSSGQWSEPGSRSWWNRVAQAMDVACHGDGTPKCKLHGLRMLDPAIFHRLPLTSADSTNAVRNSSNMRRFGQYAAPNASTRMSIIAERIEQHQSAAVWVPISSQRLLVFADDFELSGEPCKR